ncbi:hypothetical protein Cme02nite_27670 [Catellatospora methionotrophica]|uniref:HTH araC/xylS-type domain-containing protein n=1 Tax=Catellatospora methionotrophica TaxID=121620 RepID=A0A8J3L8Y4_9ACTN|nr:helix-turn-helix domain-containing protein [Catellatospora methionotrophica]GIG14435.1 hypothetical protein Cme02nite_27670 [Catellatospora methionotrophica]
MYWRYDTRAVDPRHSYDYYCDGVGDELAPFAVHGRRPFVPPPLSAQMSAITFGGLTIDSLTYRAAGLAVEARRGAEQIRTSDPECYQFCLSVHGDLRKEQEDHRVVFRPRDLVLYDLSLPQRSQHSTTPAGMKVIKLSVPKSMVPVSPDRIRQHVGALIPRRMPGKDLLIQLLLELADRDDYGDEPATAAALHEYTVQMIGQLVDSGRQISPTSLRDLRMALFRSIVHRHHGDPELDTERIADEAKVSKRLLQKTCQSAGTTPMTMVKHVRLDACRDSLRNPQTKTMRIQDICIRHGYTSLELFARHFKMHTAATATDFRRQADPR